MLAGAAVGPDGAELLEATCRVAAASNRAPGSSRSPLSLSARPQLRAGGGRAPPGVLCRSRRTAVPAKKGQNFRSSDLEDHTRCRDVFLPAAAHAAGHAAAHAPKL
jgi:hypothetical protein